MPVTTPILVYRIVRAVPDLSESFKSNQELGKPLRQATPEQVYRIVWSGISVFETVEQARSLARRIPQLGDAIACVRLEPGRGFSTASWGSRGHLSAWGDRDAFVNAVVEVLAVDD